MPQSTAPWRDLTLSAETRIRALLDAMTLDEKIAQLGSSWPGSEEAEGDVAPMQETHLRAESFEQAVVGGLGQITRNYGTAPIDPAEGGRRLAALQTAVTEGNRFGIPAVAHEECLTGVTAWKATVYPTPLAWGATFDPQIVREMAARIGGDLRDLGVQQGLSPVLDVVRDYRWGRVEETIGEDPNLVAEIGTAYVEGIESAGVVATPKHFAGYSASRGARNHAPVSIGVRELQDVILPPFERALQTARSVMNSYTDTDGVPAGADHDLLTRLLRDTWGFEGTVVSDYWAIPFLHSMHRIARNESDAARLAMRAGMDVELPHRMGFTHLAELVSSGALSETDIDRAAERVLRQKLELGLLDPDWSAPDATGVDLDSADNIRAARAVAERSIVLVRNDGLLPLTEAPARIAVVGPVTNDPGCLFGCYSFPNHVLPHHPGLELGISAPTYLDAVRGAFPGAQIVHESGTSVSGGETEGIEDAVRAARDADIVLLFVGDRSGMFGHGTSGEGCDATDLTLPGAQQDLLTAVLETGTPTAVVVSSGRPYSLASAPTRASAILQTFFPGQEGAGALADILCGAVNPSGRLPVQIPALAGSQPSTYLAPPLALRSDGVSNIDPTPAYPFGHGLSYTTFEHALVHADTVVDTDGDVVTLTVDVTNIGDRPGADVVQLYVGTPYASVVQPVRRLLGFARVDIAAGTSTRLSFTIPVEALAITGVDRVKAVEPGRVTLTVARSASDVGLPTEVELSGERNPIGLPQARFTSFTTIENDAPPVR
ncbi:beta-glucosidase [Microbacterium endophyticum]|uniref:Beta-glucosidase n=1 Tax=Microbacterium endophyticum TaxID=1526412 RepID=A0A7W4YNU2_9MICO|nr:glycoside hydrolase family 3 N-terminal domain-containing protein [Microbacterium endophyticum]MBB2976929.1 beta-glucosidase [Microbacterium endophyticum]NIK35753.1 beta-glucosidase [Microbacterium endophyticum]